MTLAAFYLILNFSCGAGCGEPPKVEFPTNYASMGECKRAGNEALSRRANPTGAVKSYDCRKR